MTELGQQYKIEQASPHIGASRLLRSGVGRRDPGTNPIEVYSLVNTNVLSLTKHYPATQPQKQSADRAKKEIKMPMAPSHVLPRQHDSAEVQDGT